MDALDVKPGELFRDHRGKWRCCCARCGQISSFVPIGKWCIDCYLWIIGETHHDTGDFVQDKEYRIKRYAERAAQELPLFEA